MGTWYEFTCEQCSYRAKVSGGSDCGMIAMTETMVCNHCKRVVDVLVKLSPSAFNYPHVPSTERMNLCPKCGCRDVTPWPSDRPCPKCGSGMKKGDAAILWD